MNQPGQGYGQGPHGQGYGPPGGYPGRPTHSGATTSMYLGIGAIFTAGLLSIPAILIAQKAKKEIAARPNTFSNEAQATVGLVCGWVGVGLFVVMVLKNIFGPGESKVAKDGVLDAGPAASAVASVRTKDAAPPIASAAGPVETPKDETVIGKLQRTAVSPKEYEKTAPLWAMLPRGTSNCDGFDLTKASDTELEALSNKVSLAIPQDRKAIEVEYAARKKAVEESRGQIQANALKKLVSVHCRSKQPVRPGPQGDHFGTYFGCDDGLPFSGYIREYDMKTKSYAVAVNAHDDSHWAIGKEDPIVSTKQENDSYIERQKTGLSIGGKRVGIDVATNVSWTKVENHSMATWNVPMPEDASRAFAEKVDVDVVALLRPTKVRLHKACRKDPAAPPGQGITDDGLGLLWSARTIAWQVRFNGDVVAHQDPESKELRELDSGDGGTE